VSQSEDRRLVLIGLPASGKSSVAAELAHRLGLPHLDSDRWVEEATGHLIGDIFADQGEEAFRRLEEQAVAAILAGPAAVVSLGGGAILSPVNRQALVGQAVVWLDVSVTVATRRAGLNRLRPLLLGDLRRQLERLNSFRRPLYAAAATWRIEVDHLSIAAVADEVLRLAELNDLDEVVGYD